MKSAPFEASSDLEGARALSRKLVRRVAPPAVTAPRPHHPEQRYARLSAWRAVALPPLERGARWPRIVEWARHAVAASSAFAIDRRGLLVGATHMADNEATRIGGRLAVAFEQSAQIDAVRSLVIDWAGETVTLVEIRDPDDVSVLLGIVGHPRPVPVVALVEAVVAALQP